MHFILAIKGSKELSCCSSLIASHAQALLQSLKPLVGVQVLNRPPTEAPHALSGMGGMEHGLVDLQMATEAFRDAFSATAPSMEGPSNSDQDFLLAEAFKSPPNPITGAVASTRPQATLRPVLACMDGSELRCLPEVFCPTVSGTSSGYVDCKSAHCLRAFTLLVVICDEMKCASSG